MKKKYLLIGITLFLIVNGSLSTSVCAQVNVLFGMTEAGGTAGQGVLFQYNPGDSAYTKKFDFSDMAKGSYPYGSLMQALDGNLYGMTSGGGTDSDGVLFQYNPVTSTYTKEFDFSDTLSGSNPRGALMQALDGNFYGMTGAGGANGVGVIFQFNPVTASYLKKFDFGAPGVSGITGKYPNGSLMQASDGKLYGLAQQGGESDFGVLFQFDPVSFTFTQKFSFAWDSSGAYPMGSLIQASDGNLYGMTEGGGAGGGGVLFKYNPVTSKYIKELDFGAIGVTGPTGGISGLYPNGSLVQASDGNLYGMTYEGGVNNDGVLFQFSPLDSVYTKKLDFDGATNGSNPFGSLIQASDGNLYGVTYGGGANNAGVLFQFNPTTSSYTKKLDFTEANGGFPEFSNLVEIALTTGVKEFSGENDISISPNPASNQLTIYSSSLRTNETVTITIMNVLGEIILEEKLKWSNQIIMNTQNLQADVYFLQIKLEDGSVVKKFVKE